MSEIKAGQTWVDIDFGEEYETIEILEVKKKKCKYKRTMWHFEPVDEDVVIDSYIADVCYTFVLK